MFLRFCLHILDGIGNKSIELSGDGADQAVAGLAVLEDLEGGHGADAELLGDIGKLIDVDLDEVRLVAEGLREPVGTTVSILYGSGCRCK